MRHAAQLHRRALREAKRRCGVAIVRRAGVRDGVDPGSTSVAITFDDGPDPVHTPAILDELARLDVVATFFLVGHRARSYPAIVRRMVAEGHAVGSHSNSHPEPWGMSMQSLVREYRQGRAEVEAAAFRPAPLFRPPKGFVDTRGAAAMLAAGVRPWLWTIDPGDWVPDVLPTDIVAAVDGLRSGDVVLLHDAIEGPLAPSALDRSATRAALHDIVMLARGRGLRLTTLT